MKATHFIFHNYHVLTTFPNQIIVEKKFSELYYLQFLALYVHCTMYIYPKISVKVGTWLWQRSAEGVVETSQQSGLTEVNIWFK